MSKTLPDHGFPRQTLLGRIRVLEAERDRLRAAFDHTARLVHGLHGGPRFEDCGERFCVKNRAVLSLSNPTATTPGGNDG